MAFSLRAVPWAFFADLLLALVPMFDANRLLYSWWSSLIICWLVLALLRFADGRTVRRKWNIWRRMAVKAVIIIGVEFLVSAGAIEECNAVGANCHWLF